MGEPLDGRKKGALSLRRVHRSVRKTPTTSAIPFLPLDVPSFVHGTKQKPRSRWENCSLVIPRAPSAFLYPLPALFPSPYFLSIQQITFQRRNRKDNKGKAIDLRPRRIILNNLLTARNKFLLPFFFLPNSRFYQIEYKIIQSFQPNDNYSRESLVSQVKTCRTFRVDTASSLNGERELFYIAWTTLISQAGVRKKSKQRRERSKSSHGTGNYSRDSS